ncbi:Glycosyltransferase involved in cell wall bisynthesis [Pseudidiomarina maritima]|uniref:Glycosyltransferase involved in cell wall bisynthesis n=1 Tax=Pseudidiomarina maritima TaxID=519453 RepID=A0A1I6GRY5_9GAMM|nr:glycosyltransferase family 4 protein [Pseudidiomarina maritima]SFR44879.1 Glycosyltransferase involved in cell wall bisynthesis [Pseudidiomarina maritima]
MGKLKLHVIGALPGPLGGTTVLFEQLVSELRNHNTIDLSVSDTTQFKKAGLLKKVYYFVRCLYYCSISEVTVLNTSANGALYFGPILLFFVRLFRKRFMLRMFGGIFNDTYKKYGVFKREIMNGLLNRSDTLFFETDLVVNYFRDRFPNTKIVKLPNSRPKSKLKCDYSIMSRYVFVGAIKRSKGVLDLLEVAKDFPQAHFSFAGPIIEQDLLKLIQNADNCNYYGVVDSNNIYKFLSGASCLILPTKHFGEGYPGVILEAYSIGLPVITTRWRSIPEIVEEGVTGYLTEVGSLSSLFHAIINFENLNSSEKERMGERARCFFLANFESERVLNIFLSKIKEQ